MSEAALAPTVPRSSAAAAPPGAERAESKLPLSKDVLALAPARAVGVEGAAVAVRVVAANRVAEGSTFLQSAVPVRLTRLTKAAGWLGAIAKDAIVKAERLTLRLPNSAVVGRPGERAGMVVFAKLAGVRVAVQEKVAAFAIRNAALRLLRARTGRPLAEH